jgi:hypothetical protein
MSGDIRGRFTSVPLEGQSHNPNVLAKPGIRLTPELSCGRHAGREDEARSRTEPERRLPLFP